MGDSPGSETYNYMANIASPGALGILSDGDAAQLQKNFKGMNTYFQIISGGESAGKAMGPRYLFKTDARCVPGVYSLSLIHI